MLGIVLVIEGRSQGLDDRSDYEMLDLALQIGEVLDRVQDELHELAGRCFDDLGAEVEVLVQRLNCLAHDVAQRSHHKSLDVLVAAEARLNLGISDQLLALLELAEDVVGARRCHHVVAELIRGREYDVPHFGEVLDDDVSLVVLHVEELTRATSVHAVVVHELSQ